MPSKSSTFLIDTLTNKISNPEIPTLTSLSPYKWWLDINSFYYSGEMPVPQSGNISSLTLLHKHAM